MNTTASHTHHATGGRTALGPCAMLALEPTRTRQFADWLLAIVPLLLPPPPLPALAVRLTDPPWHCTETRSYPTPSTLYSQCNLLSADMLCVESYAENEVSNSRAPIG